jgi:hypothetical protein
MNILMVIIVALSLLAPVKVQAAPLSTVSPMGCTTNEVFADIQDWWTHADKSKDHGHLHVGICFPFGKTISGTYSFRVRTVLHHNPGILTRIAMYVESSPLMTGTTTCATNGGLACVKTVPRKISECSKTAGVLTDNGETCTWWDSLSVNIGAVKEDGYQEFRMKGYVKEPDGTEMIVSNALIAYVNNGRTVSNTSNPTRLTGRGWYTNAGYANANLESPPMGKVAGIWKPYVIFNAPSGDPITGYYAALDTDFHNNNPGTPIKSGTSAWRGNLSIDTTMLTNGWHRLFLKSDAAQPDGFTNSGVLAIWFEIDNSRN